MKKTDSNQISSIKELLLEGCSLDEIVEAVGVSKSTVKRIKKELTDNNVELAQILNENKYNTKIKKSEAKYLVKIENERNLFEDKEEGWTYHLTAEELKHKESGKWWCFIVYPESAEKDWKERLQLLGCELAISPLHDKDTWNHDSPAVIDEETGEVLEEQGSRYKAGDRKKSHWHCILKFEKTISYQEANKKIRDITFGPYISKCYSLKGQYEYFIHLNNPEKYQYEKDEIERYNGFIVETTQADRIIMIDEIGKIISDKGFLNLNDVRQYYEGQYEYINVIALKSYYFEKLTQVNYRKMYPEGRTQKVRIVTESEDK